jgi:hypothetical protein
MERTMGIDFLDEVVRSETRHLTREQTERQRGACLPAGGRPGITKREAERTCGAVR